MPILKQVYDPPSEGRLHAVAKANLVPALRAAAYALGELRRGRGHVLDRLSAFWHAVRGLGSPMRLAFGPLILSLDWAFWGCLHFFKPDVGAKEMPEFIRSSSLFALAGAGEILLALLLWSRWRRYALLGTCALLILFLPAVVWMLVDDVAMGTLAGEHASPRALAIWRLVLIIHNTIMFLWSYSLYVTLTQRVSPVAASPSETVLARAVAPARRWRAAWLVAAVMLLANLAGLYAVGHEPWYSTTPTLWSLGFLAGGALVGFIFGVPKTAADEPSNEDSKPPIARTSRPVGYRANTNIEVISDWLTKMIVGVGLVEFHQVGSVVERLGAVLAGGLKTREPSMRPTTEAEALSFAKAIVVYFALAGVIQGYLLTRMFLARVFEESELAVAAPRPPERGGPPIPLRTDVG